MRLRVLVLSVVAAMCLSAAAFAAVPASSHVFVVVEENHSYESVIGNTSMPYFNSLAQKYGLATQYYANSHYSIPNYMWLAAGAYVTMSDNTTSKFTVDNIVPHLLVAGKTWKEYAESLPYAGYTGYNTGYYVERHDPFAYFTDVANSSQKYNIVPFTELATDIANHTLPNYGFITPNLVDDAHNGTLATADQWLQKNIAPLIASPEFQKDGILIITFDESVNTDCRPAASCPALPENVGGGRVATVVIGPKVKPGYRSTTFYQHPSTLKTMAMALGLTSFPGAATSAPDMGEFFTTTATTAATLGSVSISLPIASTVVGSPVQIAASATPASSAHPITAIKLYLDYKAAYTVNSNVLSTSLAMGAGTHRLVAVAWDSAGTAYTSAPEYFSVAGVAVQSPSAGTSVASPVHVQASAFSAHPITTMRVYVDNLSTYQVSGATLNAYVPVSSGGHNVVVQAWDSTGAVYKTSTAITTQ